AVHGTEDRILALRAEEPALVAHRGDRPALADPMAGAARATVDAEVLEEAAAKRDLSVDAERAGESQRIERRKTIGERGVAASVHASARLEWRRHRVGRVGARIGFRAGGRVASEQARRNGEEDRDHDSGACDPAPTVIDTFLVRSHVDLL